MALNNMGLGVTFTARDAMSGVLFRLQRAFSGLELTSKAAVATIGAGFAGMAAGIGVVTAGLAGLESAFNLASNAGRFEAAITKIGTVAQVSGQPLENLRNAAMDAAQRSGYATQEVAQGLEDIAAMGFTAQQSVMMLTPALNLAAAGTISVADAADAMGSAMKVFGIEATQANMEGVASKLLGIANTTALQAHDLRIALGTVGRGASAAKQNLDEMLISMGLVKNTGVDATVAASSVSSALLFMAEKADKFKKIGVDVTDAAGHFRPFLDVVLDVNKALADTGNDAKAVAQIKDLFQRFGITAYQAIATQLTTGVYDELTGKTYKYAEAVEYLRKEQVAAAERNLAQQNADKLLATYDRLTKRLTAIGETFAITVGQGFIDFFRPALQGFVEALQGIERFLRSTPKEVKIFGAAMFTVGAIMTVTTGIALILSGALAILAGALFLAGWPLLLFLAGFAAVALPLTLLTVKLTAAMLAFGAGIGTILHENLGGAVDKLKAWYTRWKTIVTSILGFFSSGELEGENAKAFLALDADTQQFITDITLQLKKVEVFARAFWARFKELMGTEGVSAIGTVFDALMGLGKAMGIVDEQTLEAMKGTGPEALALRGKAAAEVLVESFRRVAETLASIIDKVTWLINHWDMLKAGWGMSQTGRYVATGNFGKLMDTGVDVFRSVWGLDKEEGAAPEKPYTRIPDYANMTAQQRLYTGMSEGQINAAIAQREADVQYGSNDKFLERLREAGILDRDSSKQPIIVNVHVGDEQVLQTVTNAQESAANAYFGAHMTPIGGR